MFWIFLQILFVLFNQIIATEREGDLISAEFVLHEKGYSQLNLTWEKSINLNTIEIKYLNETCNHTCLIYPKDTTTLLISPYENDIGTSIFGNDDCSLIFNDCFYNIKLEKNQGIAFWNKTLFFSAPKKLPACPNITLKPVVMSDNITINWTVNGSSNDSLTKFNQIVISIYELAAPAEVWGGKHILVMNNSFPLNTSEKTEKIIQGYWNLYSSIPLLQDYEIQAYITDFYYCPVTKQRLQRKQILEVGLFLIIATLFGIITISSIIIIIYKRWKKPYSNIIANHITSIPMESNILYIETDNILNNNNDDFYEICPNDVIKCRQIGFGEFGKVFKGFIKCRDGSTKTVAIKQLKQKYELENEFFCEIETMKNVGKHEHIVELLGYCTKQHPMMMVMEFVDGGNLLSYLKRIGQKQKIINSIQNNSGSSYQDNSESSYISQPALTSNILKPSVTETMYTDLSTNYQEIDLTLTCDEFHNFALQIAEGMHYLEEIGITHRDLAARNVLITEKRLLKISDFGLSKNGIYVKKTRSKVPLRWLSIEAIRENFYSSKSDVWAFGVVLWEIGTYGECEPYRSTPNSEVLNFLLRGNRLHKPEICSEKLYNLMTDCWQEDLEERPSFYAILKFLKSKGQNLYVQLNSLGSDYVFSS